MDGLDFANLTWENWWMLVSAAMVLAGFIGRQAVQALVGARQIVNRNPEEAGYSVMEEQVLSGRSANRDFKAQVGRKSLGTGAGRLFFWVLVLGLVAHAGFWIYAATVMERGAG